MKTIQVFVIGAILTTALSFSGLNVRIVTAKSKPLSTAGIWNTYGPHSTGFIPRLEPGLRYVQARINFLSKPKDSVRISLFNLNQLSNFDPEERKPNRFSRLFGDTGASIGKLTARLIQQATKLVAAVLLFASGSLLSMRPLPSVAHASELHATFVKKAGVSLASITAAAIATGATMEPAQAGVFNFNRDMLKLKRYSQLTPTERLATTPLYFVANSRGNSYLQSDAQAGRPEQKIVTYFMSSEDAADFLNEMTQVNGAGGGGSAEFRLMTVSMEKVMNQIQARKQSRKLGRYEMDTIYRIQPSSRQVDNAQKQIAKVYGNNLIKSTQALKGINIPMFSAQGLALSRANGEVLSPYYFAYEDLLEDWAKLRASVTTSSTSASESNSVTTSASTATSTTAGSAEMSPGARGGFTIKGLKGTVEARLGRTSASPTAISAEPKVQVHEFADVMILANGITADSLAALPSAKTENTDALSAAKSALLKQGSVAGRIFKGRGESVDTVGSERASAEKTGRAALSTSQANKLKKEIVGFMPPRREIDMIRRYYRNQSGFKNEFSKSKFLG